MYGTKSFAKSGFGHLNERIRRVLMRKALRPAAAGRGATLLRVIALVGSGLAWPGTDVLGVQATMQVGRHPLTVREAVESTRIEGNVTGWQFAVDGIMPIVQDVLISPHGSRYVIRLIKGDLKKNGDWIEIVTGGLGSLHSAQNHRVAKRLFSPALGGADCSVGDKLTVGYWNPIVWLNDYTVAFLYKSASRPAEAISLDLKTGKITDLTHSATDVISFAAESNGTVLYYAKMPHSRRRSKELLTRGFVVTNADAFSLLRGDVDGYDTMDRCRNTEWFIFRKGWRAPKHISTNVEGYQRWWATMRPSFSRGGGLAIIAASPSVVPRNWEHYHNRVLAEEVRAAQQDIKSQYARGVQELFVVRVESAKARSLWDAPSESATKVVWSPNDKDVAIGPTYLPLDASGAGGVDGSSVAVVNVASGRVTALPATERLRKAGITGIEWPTAGEIVVRAGRLREVFRNEEGSWALQQAADVPEASERASGVAMVVRQDMNSFPSVIAIDRMTGQARTVLVLDEKLRSKVSMGKVVPFAWSDDKGRPWRGRLYYPVSYKTGVRYPLVIQAHGIPPDWEFSLYGGGNMAPGLGPGVGVFAAEELAGRGIVVLDVQDRVVNSPLMSPDEPRMYMGAYEAAVHALDSAGVIDKGRVGISGYSRTGWHVEYALTHSAFPYRAAIINDNLDPSYIQETLFPQHEYALDDGAMPFGDGLVKLVHEAPGFLADRIHSPVLFIQSAGGLEMTLGMWEMFERLRELKRPVELAVIPEIQRGTHGTQNPAQCFAAQERTVAWFDFWLNGREDADARWRKRYVRWRRLQALERGWPDSRLSGVPLQSEDRSRK